MSEFQNELIEHGLEVSPSYTLEDVEALYEKMKAEIYIDLPEDAQIKKVEPIEEALGKVVLYVLVSDDVKAPILFADSRRPIEFHSLKEAYDWMDFRTSYGRGGGK